MRAIIIFLFAEIRDGKIRQKIDKTSFRLCYQAVPVCKKQYIFDPSMIQKDFDKSDHGSRLSGTGCHDK